MRVKDVGEFDLIEKLANTLGAEAASRACGKEDRRYRLRHSVGDDAAAWHGPAGTRVLTTDAMVEEVHFSLGWISWEDLGWKSIASNVSDVAAMGCRPLYSVVSLGLRDDLPVEGLEEMYRGMLEACRQLGGQVVGGDVVRSPVFFVSVAMVGATTYQGSGAGASGPLLTRRAASPGDAIAVTGTLGCSGGGLRMLRGDIGFDKDVSAHLRNAHNRPTARVEEGMLLARHGVLAAMDVSDGLVADLAKMCRASGVGATIRSDRVPADDVLKRAFPDDWLSLALSGGEDYELLFSAPPGVVESVAPMLGVPVSLIGEIVGEASGVTLMGRQGKTVEVDDSGWDHFDAARVCRE